MGATPGQPPTFVCFVPGEYSEKQSNPFQPVSFSGLVFSMITPFDMIWPRRRSSFEIEFLVSLRVLEVWDWGWMDGWIACCMGRAGC